MMGTRLIRWAFDDAPADLPPVELLALVSLAEWARDSTGECWPSRGAIAARLRRSERTADRVIAELMNRGLIEVVKPAAPGRRPVYRLVERATSVTHERETPMAHDPGVTCATPDSNVRNWCLERAPSGGAQNRHSRQEPSPPRAPARAPAHVSHDETDAVIQALRERTGKAIDEQHAGLVIRQLLDGRNGVRNRLRYLVGTIETDSNPHRFLPTPTPPRYGAE